MFAGNSLQCEVIRHWCFGKLWHIAHFLEPINECWCWPRAVHAIVTHFINIQIYVLTRNLLLELLTCDKDCGDYIHVYIYIHMRTHMHICIIIIFIFFI